MINKSKEEHAKLIEKRKELIESKRRMRFPKWTIDELKFIYGIDENNKKHPINKMTINNKEFIPKDIKARKIKVEEVKSNGKRISTDPNTATNTSKPDDTNRTTIK